MTADEKMQKLPRATYIYILEPISKLKKRHFDESRSGKLKPLKAISPGKQQFSHDSDASKNARPHSATDFEVGSSFLISSASLEEIMTIPGDLDPRWGEELPSHLRHQEIEPKRGGLYTAAIANRHYVSSLLMGNISFSRLVRSVIVTAWLFTPVLVFADNNRVEVYGEESYTYGDNESLIMAKDTSRALAIRRAIESYSIYVQATSAIKDNRILADIIQTISSAYLHDLRVEQQQDGRTIHTRVTAYLIPTEINSVLESVASHRKGRDQPIPPEIQRRLNQRIRELPGLIEEARQQIDKTTGMVDRYLKTDADNWTRWMNVLDVWMSRHSNYLFERTLASWIITENFTYDKFVSIFGPSIRGENHDSWSVWVWNVDTANLPGATRTMNLSGTRGEMTVYFTDGGVAYDYRLDVRR